MEPQVESREAAYGRNGHQNGYQNGHHSAPLQLISWNSLNEPPKSEEPDIDLLALLTVLRRRVVVLIGVALAVTTTVGVRTLLETPIYESHFQILVEPIAANNELPGFTSPREGLAQGTGLDYETQIQVLRSPEILEPVLQQIQSDYPTISYGALIGNLFIYRVGDTKILAVHYRSSDPIQVQTVLGHVAQGYLDYSLLERQTSLRQGIGFVEEQLPQMRDRVNNLQQTLQNLQEEYRLIDPSLRSAELTGQITTVTEQLQDLQQQFIEAQNRYQDLQSISGATLALRSDPLYQQQLANLKEIDAQIAMELAQSRENSLEVQALQRQRQNLLPLLTQEAGNALDANLTQVAQFLQSLEQKQAELFRSEQLLQQQITQLPALTRIFTGLQQELEIATGSLDRLLAAREALQLESAQKEIPWQLLLTPHLPGIPVSPNLARSLGMGAGAGLILGVVVAFLVDRLDNVFHTVDELRTSTKAPILGLIPYNPVMKLRQPNAQQEDFPQFASSQLANGFVEADSANVDATNIDATNIDATNIDLGNKKTQSASYGYHGQSFTEAFRTLAINLCFLSSDTPMRSLVVSSALPGEGKSTVSMNLAQAAAAMGQRVLLVDADLRRPQVHRSLSLLNAKGLSNLIASNLTYDEVVQPSGLEENLLVITSGQRPPDPSRLLSSERMKTLVKEFSTQFDLVIYDTPPLLGLSESSLLAAQVDGIVVVAGLGRTNRSALQQVLDGLRASRANLLGLIANSLKQSATLGSYDYYYYRYSQYYGSDRVATNFGS